MKPISTILAIAAISLLTGCAGMRDHNACVSYGAEPGSSQYAQCRQSRDIARQQRRANALLYYNNFLLNQNLQQQRQQNSRPITCYKVGTTVTCQ